VLTCRLLQLQPQPLLQELHGDLLPCPAGSPEVQGHLIDGVATKVAVDTEGKSFNRAPRDELLRVASSLPYRQFR